MRGISPHGFTPATKLGILVGNDEEGTDAQEGQLGPPPLSGRLATLHNRRECERLYRRRDLSGDRTWLWEI